MTLWTWTALFANLLDDEWGRGGLIKWECSSYKVQLKYSPTVTETPSPLGQPKISVDLAKYPLGAELPPYPLRASD